jgi:glycosyltransferase involved in cell wall biosynthesis
VPKNEDWFLDVAAAAITALPNVHFVIAGDGPHEAAVRQRIASEGLMNRVTLLGYRDPLAVYHAADALLVPSLREGFCFAALEAMSAGAPVLRTRTGGAMAQIIEDITGRATNINREAFVGAALSFLADRAALKRMGQAAAAHVRATLTFDLQVERTIALYQRIAKNAPRGMGVPPM